MYSRCNSLEKPIQQVQQLIKTNDEKAAERQDLLTQQIKDFWKADNKTVIVEDSTQVIEFAVVLWGKVI